MAPIKDRLDIKSVLKAVDTRDFKWYDALSEDEKKKLSVWQVMRFVSSCESRNDEVNYHYLTLTNDLVNTHFNTLRLYPDLQFRLMQLVGIGSTQYHSWIAPSKRDKSDKVREWLSEQYSSYNEEEIDLMLSKNTTNELKEYARELGLQEKEITDIFGK